MTTTDGTERTVSGLPRFLLRDTQVLSVISITFSVLGGTLQEMHRVVGASQLDVVAVQILSNLCVSFGTIAAAVVFFMFVIPTRSLQAAWRAERSFPLWVAAVGGAAGGAGAALLLRAGNALWLIASSALWMVLAGILVHVIARGARRIETQAADLTRTVEELRASRIQLVQADSEVRQAIAERLHGPIQSQLIGLEHDLREHGNGAAAARLRVFRIETIREIAHQLHPMLLDVGLLPALDALAARSPLAVTINASPTVATLDDLGEGALSTDLRRAVHVIVEEGLLNASTAGHATGVDIELEIAADLLVVSVWDDGVGVRMPITRGLGLRSIDTWVTGLGGSWSLLPRVGRGSALTAELPL